MLPGCKSFCLNLKEHICVQDLLFNYGVTSSRRTKELHNVNSGIKIPELSLNSLPS